jgi:hypothetical protein
VARGIIFSIKGGFEAEMQGEIINGPPHLWVGDDPFAMESRIAGTKSSVGRIKSLNDAAILANKHVITDLVIIMGMGSDEGIDRRTQPVDGFMQHDHPWLRVNAIAEGIVFLALAKIGRVNADALHPLIQLGVLISKPLAQAWVGGEAGIGKG